MMNPFLVLAMRMGISVWGSRVLEVRGRTTGAPRRTPVNLLLFEGREYLVSPRGTASGRATSGLTMAGSSWS